MSLILEALRKLERDKPAPERGVVVMTSAGLASERRPAPGWLWLAAGVAAGLAMAVTMMALRRPPTPPPPVQAKAKAPPPVAVSVPVVPSAQPFPSASPSAPPVNVDVTVPAPAHVLQAITIQEGRPVALINDRVLREGDEIDGLRVVRIGEAEVEVEANGVRTTLRF